MPTQRIERLDTTRIARILSVALEEFARYPYYEASFNRIIKQCGMAKGTMYYYFKSKEDLFMTLHKGTLREFRPLVEKAKEEIESASDFWPHMSILLQGICHIMHRKPTISLFVNNFLTRQSQRQKHPAAETVTSIESWLLQKIRQGKALGVLRQDISDEQLVSLSWGLWESCKHWLPSDDLQHKPVSEPFLIMDLFERSLRPAFTNNRTTTPVITEVQI